MQCILEEAMGKQRPPPDRNAGESTLPRRGCWFKQMKGMFRKEIEARGLDDGGW